MITGMALGWIGATTSFGSVVRNPNKSLCVSPSFTFRTEVQRVQIPAKQARGRDSSKAKQLSPPAALLNSLKDVNGTAHRCSTPSQRCQCLLLTFRMFVFDGHLGKTLFGRLLNAAPRSAFVF